MLSKTKKDNFIILCNCGCGNGFEFNELDGELFVSSLSSDFYSKQLFLFPNLKEKLKEIRLVKHHKRNILKEIVTTKDNLKDLLDYLERFDFKYEETNNYSYLRASKFEVDFDDENKNDYTEYFLELIGQKKDIKEIIMEKNFRKYELCLNKKEVENLKKSIKKILED